MKQSLSLISLLVADYDEAITFYTQKLGFELLEDSPQGEKRWVVVRPKGASETAILLAKASTEQQKQQIGQQAGGRVFLLHVSAESEHSFRSNPITHFGLIRSPVSVLSDHF